MPITVACSNCKKRYAVKDEMAGKRIKCPGCGSPVPVAAAPANGAAARPAAPGARPAAAAPARPAAPDVKPAAPGAKPQAPGAKPAAATVRPPAPGAKPAAARPAAPARQPAKALVGAGVSQPSFDDGDDWIDVNEPYVPDSGPDEVPGTGPVTGDWGKAILEQQEIPESMQEDIKKEMTGGEVLSWAARPRMDVLISRARRKLFFGVGIIAFPLTFLSFFIVMMFKAAGAGGFPYFPLFVMLLIASLFITLGVFFIMAPSRVRKYADLRPCFAMSNRRLYVHPGGARQTFRLNRKNNFMIWTNTEKAGITSYTGMELTRMNREVEKKFPEAGDINPGLDMYDLPYGNRLIAIDNVAQVEKMIRQKLIDPVVDKLLRGQVVLKNTFGRIQLPQDTGGANDVPVDGNIKEYMAGESDANTKEFRIELDNGLEGLSQDQKEQLNAELCTGEKVLWADEPALKSTKKRSIFGWLFGTATRHEPEYTLYALTNRRVIQWFTKNSFQAVRGFSLRRLFSFTFNLGKLFVTTRRGPVTYYPPALLRAGMEADKRITDGGNITFRRVQRQIVTTYKSKTGPDRTSVRWENHYFGLMRIRNYKAVANLLYRTLIRPCKS